MVNPLSLSLTNEYLLVKDFKSLFNFSIWDKSFSDEVTLTSVNGDEVDNDCGNPFLLLTSLSPNKIWISFRVEVRYLVKSKFKQKVT